MRSKFDFLFKESSKVKKNDFIFQFFPLYLRNKIRNPGLVEGNAAGLLWFNLHMMMMLENKDF